MSVKQRLEYLRGEIYKKLGYPEMAESVKEAKWKDPGTGKVMTVKIVKDHGNEVEILDPSKHPAGPGGKETTKTIRVAEIAREVLLDVKQDVVKF